MIKLIPAALTLALGVTSAVVPVTTAHAEAVCRSGYHWVADIKLKDADGNPTRFKASVFKRDDKKRDGIQVWSDGGGKRRYMFGKVSKYKHGKTGATKLIKTAHGWVATPCRTFPVTTGWYKWYGSASTEPGGKRLAKVTFRVQVVIS